MLKCLESAIAICLLRECRITSLISSPRRGDTKNHYSIRVVGIGRHLEISKLLNHWKMYNYFRDNPISRNFSRNCYKKVIFWKEIIIVNDYFLKF